MRLPICEADAANGFLCSACQTKFDKGELTPADVKAAEVLHKERGPLSLDSVSVSRAFDTGKTLVLITETEAGMLIGRHGKVVATLAKEFGKLVKVIHNTEDLRKMVEELILPVRVRGINETFTPSGKEHRIRLWRSDADRLPMPVKSIEDVATYLGGEKATVKFE